MDWRKHLPKPPALSRLDLAAVGSATILSLACLARGAVYDGAVALLLLLSLPMLFMALRSTQRVHPTLKYSGIAVLVCLVLVLGLQCYLPAGDALWQQMQAVTGNATTPVALHNKAAWVQGVGRLMLLVVTFTIALFVGSEASSARVFLQALLVSGTICLALTFSLATSDGVPENSHYSYTHGFVNANNASAYLGLMLLLAMAQAVRFFRCPAKNFYKMLVDLIDQLNIGVILKGGFLLFALLLALAGLFMTGSRGGIAVSLLCGAILFLTIVAKMNLQPDMRKGLLVAASLAMGAMLVWSFINFGQVLTNKFETNGTSTNTRLEIYGAVLPMIADYPLLGGGLGSFPDLFQQYRPTDISSDGIIDKAHNSYLEFAAEMGLPAFLVLMAGLGCMGLVLLNGVRTRQERYVIPALGLVTWLFAALYSLVDFPLQIPGLAATFLAVTTVCAAQCDPRFSKPETSTTAAPVERRRVRKRRRSSIRPIA